MCIYKNLPVKRSDGTSGLWGSTGITPKSNRQQSQITGDKKAEQSVIRGEDLKEFLDAILTELNTLGAGLVSAGVYIYILKAGNYIQTKKMVLLK